MEHERGGSERSGPKGTGTAAAGALVDPRRRPVDIPAARTPQLPDHRPRIEPEIAIIGLTRYSRTKLGSRLFTYFFAMVFAVIVIDLIVALLNP